MLCYKDMTFCSFYKDCKDGETCERALTDEVKADAKNWGDSWGCDDTPICEFTEKPECFKKGGK